jgi:hypothetical protein
MSLSKRFFEQQAAATTPAQKLTRAREQVRTALYSVEASEGRLLDFDTAEAITANLLAAVRTMEEVTMHVTVTERMVQR